MMQYKGYSAKVEIDPDAGVLHGEVAGIRDVVTFQGESVAELEKAFKESVDDYLEFCARRGESPEKPYSGQFVVRVDSDLHRRLSIIAQATGTSLNALVADFLRSKAAEELPETRQAGKPMTPKPALMVAPAGASVRSARSKRRSA